MWYDNYIVLDTFIIQPYSCYQIVGTHASCLSNTIVFQLRNSTCCHDMVPTNIILHNSIHFKRKHLQKNHMEIKQLHSSYTQ